MVGRYGIPFKSFLVGLLVVEIFCNLIYLGGSGSGFLIHSFFYRSVAIAQERELGPAKPLAVVDQASSADPGTALKPPDGERKKIEERIERLSKIQEQISTNLEKDKAALPEKERKQKMAEEAKIKMLSRLYASMKPNQAAAIIDKMDIEIIQKVFSQMKRKQVVDILTYFGQDRVTEISARLAETGESLPTLATDKHQ
jgi:flagellar motility protein MotE (MotC chaperone)